MNAAGVTAAARDHNAATLAPTSVAPVQRHGATSSDRPERAEGTTTARKPLNRPGLLRRLGQLGGIGADAPALARRGLGQTEVVVH